MKNRSIAIASAVALLLFAALTGAFFLMMAHGGDAMAQNSIPSAITGPGGAQAISFSTAVAVDPAAGSPAVQPSRAVPAGVIPSRGDGFKDGKLQSQLGELSRVNQRDGLDEAKKYADERGMKLEGDDVVVVLESGGDTQAAERAAADAGGRVEAVHGELVQAAVPVGSIDALAASAAVAFVREPLRPQPAVTSEGVVDIGADTWQAAGETGAGVKLAILDLGFEGYPLRQAEGELPASLTVMSFRADGDITGGGEVHGTACAEIAHDVAPGGQLYLVNFSTDVELANAVDYLKAQGVEVISASWSFMGMFRGDGQGTVDDIVQDAHDSGITWVNASGNSARSHWSGAFADSNANGWNDFAAGDEGNDIYLSAGSEVGVFLTWDGWPTTDQDYDLYLFWSGQLNTPVAQSTGSQTGSQAPAEALYYQVPPGKGGYYLVAIKNYSASGGASFHLLTTPYDLQYRVPAGSLGGQPADSPAAITVGAVAVGTTVLEDFSSQGPTIDGRIKPDVVAPDRVSTVSYGTGGMFWGTSAATPHTAAAAALALGANPSYSPDDVQAWLEGRAADLGAPGKDNQFGSGKIDLGLLPDTEAPLVSGVDPSGTLYSNSATINVYYSDAGSGIDISSVTVSLDGSELSGCSVTAASASCSVNGLSGGSHGISGSVADIAGNVTPFSGSFEVVCTQPELALGSPSSFWATYSDYLAGLLSVDFSLCNNGPNDAYNIELLGSINTSGVQLATPVPAAIGDLSAGVCADVTFKYLVPPGVVSFKTTSYIRADGPCGISYDYPEPYNVS